MCPMQQKLTSHVSMAGIQIPESVFSLEPRVFKKRVLRCISRRLMRWKYLYPELHAIAKITNVTTIPKITITAKITKIINQGRDTDKYNASLKESGEMITNQVYSSGKYNKSLKESRERGFTDVTKIPKMTIQQK